MKIIIFFKSSKCKQILTPGERFWIENSPPQVEAIAKQLANDIARDDLMQVVVEY